MGYESVSALIVLIILVALWFGWLPNHTINGMKTMLEHREDRFSPTLHLVGEWSIARICDGTGMLAKEACMQPTQQKRKLTPERIARIRAARRAAIRRRCVLVASLAVLTFLVFLAGCSGLFSPAFALIPGAMVAVVLYFGSRASKHARQWEARVAKMGANSKRNVEDSLYENHNSDVVSRLGNSSGVGAIDGGAAVDYAAVADAVVDADRVENFESDASGAASRALVERCGDSRDDTATSVMEQHEIRVALRRAAEERDAVLRERNASKSSERSEFVNSSSEDVSDNAEAVSGANNNQDLISFSLGSDSQNESNNSSLNPAPESLEIKSTKQVAKAIPVDKSAEAAKSAKSSKVIESSANANSSKFHAEEQASDVEAPESSEDSLGVANLHDVLARRNA
ncbi:hypothetical protein [Gardnerella vaginalis]|uniref:hypothetical protein n=1 Tax=Gardnerella vaginalis TaxID=2702 RepID=UPI0039EDE84D